MRIGVIGVGEAFARAHLPVINSLPVLDLVAVADVDGPRLAETAERTGARPFADPAAMIEDPEIEAVVIATPPDVQIALARAAMERGLPVLLEKPMGMPRDDLADLKPDWTPFLPYCDTKLVDELVDTARDDEVTSLVGVLGHSGIGKTWVPRSGNWYVDPLRAGGGAFFDQSSHWLPLLGLLGVPLDRCAATVENGGAGRIEEAAEVTGPGVRMRFSWRLERPSQMLTVSFARHGVVSVDYRSGTLITARHSKSVPLSTYVLDGYLRWLAEIAGDQRARDRADRVRAAAVAARAWVRAQAAAVPSLVVD
jgi:predicted dehydrogenase